MTVTTRSCPSCSTVLPLEAQFCFHCGRATPTDPDAPPRTQATGEVEVAKVRKALAERYEVERVLGEGGMATVYLAQDLKHRRKVAVKVMRPELAATLGADRFLREVEIAGQLNHPHILPLFDSGATGGVLYYVMPYVEGETLRDRLARDGRLDPDDALRLASEVADALAYAHRRGIIHRDIKPANIMMGEGHALVADFGIARALGDEGGEALTRTGFAVGTPQYMSPEQAMGDRAVDGRADIYATGAILYEMLAGVPPFTGKTAQAILTRSLTERPTPLTVTRPDLAPGLATAVDRALARLPEDRFPTAEELKAVLERARRDMLTAVPDKTAVRVAAPATMDATPAPPAAAPGDGSRRMLRVGGVVVLALAALLAAVFGKRLGGGASDAGRATRVAVLPFATEGSESEAFVGAGIADEVRGRLTRVPGLAVVSSATATQYVGSGKRPQDIARELGADFLLLGRVRSSGNAATRQLQVVPELIDARTGQVSWTRTFEAQPSEVYSVQSEIASRVAQSLGVGQQAQAVAPKAPPTRNAPAYEAYLKGIAITGFDPASLRRSADYFEQAVALDPAFAEAWARLAMVLARAVSNGIADSSLARRGREAVTEARRLAPDDPLTLLASSRVAQLLNRDPHGARRYAHLALQKSPNDPQVLEVSATLDIEVGAADSAQAKLELAHSIDPRSYRATFGLGEFYLIRGQLARADELLEQAVQLDPTSVHAVQWLTAAKLAARDTVGARRVVRDAVARGVAPALIAAQFAGIQELSWMLEREYRDLVPRLRPSAFDNDVAFWGQSLATYYWQQGDTARARAYADSAMASSAQQAAENSAAGQLHALYGLMLAYRGRATEARAAIATAMRIDTVRNASRAYVDQVASRAEMALGNRSAALDHLKQVRGRDFTALPEILRQDPTYVSLRGDPRFEAMIASQR